MGTAYITENDAFIGKTDERLTVKANKEKLLDVPLIKLDGVVILGRATVSPAVVTELLERNIPLSFLTHTGRYIGHLEPEVSKNIFVRKAQWSAAEDSPKALHVVRGFIRGKLKNYRYSLLRKVRKNSHLDLDKKISQLEQSINSLEAATSIKSLRGLEGSGSAIYFSCFPDLIQNSNDFPFRVRTRPATDAVNCLLNLGYSLLRHDLQSAVNIVGFDPYRGYLHLEHYGRPSLALDLMEEFRPLVVDSIVLTSLNKQVLTIKDFTTEPLSNAVTLTLEGLKTFLRMYEQKKQSDFKHPVLKRKCTYQEAFEIQARLLAKYLMEETEQYPPLVLK